MCNINESISLNTAYIKYRKGKKVEETDIWALRRLNESNLITFYHQKVASMPQTQLKNLAYDFRAIGSHKPGFLILHTRINTDIAAILIIANTIRIVDVCNPPPSSRSPLTSNPNSESVHDVLS